MAKTTSSLPASITIDPKKCRIRIFKGTLHQLGDPDFIQFLVNPKAMCVAIRAVRDLIPPMESHKIIKKTFASSNSVEVYSRPFVFGLCKLIGDLDTNSLYRISGAIIPSEDIAVFPLITITKSSLGDRYHE